MHITMTLQMAHNGNNTRGNQQREGAVSLHTDITYSMNEV